jgi:hypothetical protein
MNPQLVSGAIPTSSYLQTDEANQATPNPQPVINNSQPQSGQQPSWWEKLLPTAGGILGGIGGEALDVFGGGIAGAGVGGALGQELENKLTGRNSNILAAGAENAIGSGVGGLLGKGFKAATGVGANLATKGASKLFAAQGPGIGEDLANFATQHLGINDLPTAAKFGEVISGNPDQEVNGGKGLVSNFIQDAAKNDSSKVDLSNLQPAMKGGSKAAQISQSSAKIRNVGTPGTNLTEQLISDSGLNGTTDGDALRSQINGVLGRADNPGSVSKGDLLGMQKQISSMASDASKAASRSGASADSAKAKVLNGIDSQLRTSLGFDTIKVDPEEAKLLAQDIITNGSGISESAANAVAKQITDAASSKDGLTVGQLRNMESNMVQLQQSSKDAMAATDKNFGTSTSSMLPVAGSVVGLGGKKSLLGTIAGMATASPKADSVASGLTSKLATTLGKANASKVIPMLTRSAAIGAANIPNVGASPTNNPQGGNINTGAEMQNLSSTINQSPIMQAYNTALTGGMGIGQPYDQAITTLAPEAQKLTSALPVLQQLFSGYDQAGGAQGPLSGGLSRLSGLIPGTAAHAYNQQQSAAASVLSQLLGISPQAAMGIIPQLTQSPGTAATPLAGLSGALGSIQ